MYKNNVQKKRTNKKKLQLIRIIIVVLSSLNGKS